MRTVGFFIACSVLLLVSTGLHGQTVDEILKKHAAALGGADRIAAIRTLKLTGTATRQGRRGAMESKFTRYLAFPNKVRNEMDFRGMTMLQIFDGEKGWARLPSMMGGGGLREMTAAQAGALRQMLDFAWPLLTARDKGQQVRLLGAEDFQGTEVYRLRVTQGDSTLFESYLDTEYFMEIRRVYFRRAPDGSPVEMPVQFSDFKPVDGIMMAHAITGSAGFFLRGRGRRGRRGRGFGRRGGANTILTLAQIEVNPALNDSLFAKPAK